LPSAISCALHFSQLLSDVFVNLSFDCYIIVFHVVQINVEQWFFFVSNFFDGDEVVLTIGLAINKI
jgi:hypothetical protein